MCATSRRMAIAATTISLVALAPCWGQARAEDSLLPTAASDSESQFEVTASLDTFSRYVWRGCRLGDSGSVQPSVSVSTPWGLSAVFWGGVQVDDPSGTMEFAPSVEYAFQIGLLELGVGAILYTFPGEGIDSTTELSLYCTVPLPGSPTVSIYRDIDQTRALYVSLSASGSVELPFSDHPFDLEIIIGYGDKRHGEACLESPVSGMWDLSVALSIPFALGDRLTLRPSVHFSTLLDSDVRAAAGTADNVWIGLVMASTF